MGQVGFPSDVSFRAQCDVSIADEQSQVDREGDRHRYRLGMAWCRLARQSHMMGRTTGSMSQVEMHGPSGPDERSVLSHAESRHHTFALSWRL